MSDLTLKNLAIRLIKKRGKIATLRQVTTSVTEENPGTPVTSTSDETVDIVTFPIEQKYLKGDLLMTDVQAYMSVQSDVRPAVNDRMVVNGVTHRIVEFMPIEPGNVTVLYVLFLRK